MVVWRRRGGEQGSGCAEEDARVVSGGVCGEGCLVEDLAHVDCGGGGGVGGYYSVEGAEGGEGIEGRGVGEEGFYGLEGRGGECGGGVEVLGGLLVKEVGGEGDVLL